MNHRQLEVAMKWVMTNETMKYRLSYMIIVNDTLWMIWSRWFMHWLGIYSKEYSSNLNYPLIRSRDLSQTLFPNFVLTGTNEKKWILYEKSNTKAKNKPSKRRALRCPEDWDWSTSGSSRAWESLDLLLAAAVVEAEGAVDDTAEEPEEDKRGAVDVVDEECWAETKEWEAEARGAVDCGCGKKMEMVHWIEH